MREAYSEPSGLTIYKKDKTYDGYTLYTTLGTKQVNLIDMGGETVKIWDMPYPAGLYGYLIPSGNLLYGGRTENIIAPFGGGSGIILEMGWDGESLWEYYDDRLHHDFCRMENGNTMVLGWEKVPLDLAHSIRGGIPGTEYQGGIWSDFLHEVTPDKRVVWEWHAYEHLNVNEDVICPLCERKEWSHANACEVLPDGNVMTSFRLLDTVGIIDKKTGNWKWKWGRGELGHQHDPTLLKNGNVLLFDNGMHSKLHPRSRVIEVDPGKNEIVWEYKAKPDFKFFSHFISGAQRLPKGNTLVCEGMTGRIFEVTPDKEVVWEFVNPIFAGYMDYGTVNMVFRAYRYGPDFPGFKGKELKSLHPRR